jgi:hypothetical protein
VHCDRVQVACGHHLLDLRLVTIHHGLHIETASLADSRERVRLLERIPQPLQLRNDLLDLAKHTPNVLHLQQIQLDARLQLLLLRLNEYLYDVDHRIATLIHLLHLLVVQLLRVQNVLNIVVLDSLRARNEEVPSSTPIS